MLTSPGSKCLAATATGVSHGEPGEDRAMKDGSNRGGEGISLTGGACWFSFFSFLSSWPGVSKQPVLRTGHYMHSGPSVCMYVCTNMSNMYGWRQVSSY